MSKELEAWKRIKEFDSGGEFVSLYDFHAKDIEIVDKALTPPTADEVCKALSEFFERDVKHVDGMFYYGEALQFTEICDTTIEDINNNQLYQFYLSLPSYLIVMIGKFYEGGRR